MKTLLAQFDAFTRAYLIAALWSSTDDDGTPLDENYSIANLSPELIESSVNDCKAFQEAQAGLLGMTYELDCYDPERAGHDFWLSRNGHGGGFFDRGYDVIWNDLQEAARACSSVDLYVGDDGLIYGH